MIQSRVLRRFARNSCVLAATVCVVMLGIEIGAGVSGRSLPDSNALAAAPGTAPTGAVTVSPASGTLSSGVTIRPEPSPAFCPGDSVAGYRWQTFISAASNDPATFVYNSNGPTVPGGVTPSFPLVSSTGVNQVGRNTAADTGSGGLITPIPGFDLGIYGTALPDGDYSIGFACSLDGDTVRFWTTRITITAGSYSTSTPPSTTTSTTTAATTTTTTPGATTTTPPGATTTTVAGTTTSTVAGATTSTVAASAQTATLTPAAPTAGGTYKVTHPNCRVGDTITVTQPQSTPTIQTATCAVPVAGLVRPRQTPTIGTATVTFTSAPTAAGAYTVTSTGPNSGTRTVTFTIAAASNPAASTGGSPSGTSTGTIPATGSSTTSFIVWGILLLVFGRMAILLGRKPKVIQAGG